MPMRSGVSRALYKTSRTSARKCPGEGICSLLSCFMCANHRSCTIKASPPIKEKIRRCNNCIRRIFIWGISSYHRLSLFAFEEIKHLSCGISCCKNECTKCKVRQSGKECRLYGGYKGFGHHFRQCIVVHNITSFQNGFTQLYTVNVLIL